MSSDFEDYYNGDCFQPEKTSEDDNNSLEHSKPSPVKFSEDAPDFEKPGNLDYPGVQFEKMSNQELETNYFETPTDHAGYDGLQQSIIRMSYEIAEAQGKADIDQNEQDVENEPLPQVPCKKAKLKIELLNGFSPHTRKTICSSSFSTPVYASSTKSYLPKNQNPANHIMSATGDSSCLARYKEIGDTTYSVHTPLSTVDITSLISPCPVISVMAEPTPNFDQSSAQTQNFGQSFPLTQNIDQSSVPTPHFDQSTQNFDKLPAQTTNFDQSSPQTSNFNQASTLTQSFDQSSAPTQAEGSCIISPHQDTGTILYFPVMPYLRTLVDPGVGNPIDLSIGTPVDLRGATPVEIPGAGSPVQAPGIGTSEAYERTLESHDDLEERTLDNLGEKISDDLGEKTSDVLGEKTSDDLGEKTSDDLGKNTSDDRDKNTSDEFGKNTSDNLGKKTSDDLGEKTSDDLGEKTSDDLGEKTSDDPDERSSDALDVTTPDDSGGITLETFQANVPTVTPLLNTTSVPAYDAIAKTISKILLSSSGQTECLVTSDLPEESQQQGSNSLPMLDGIHTEGNEDDDLERESHNMKERKRRARIKDACDLMRQLVPGMSEKTDKATVFEFAARYIYFLKGFVGGVHDKDFLIKYSPY